MILTKEKPLIICTDKQMAKYCDVQVGDCLDTYFQNPFNLVFKEVVEAFEFELFLIVMSDDTTSIIQTLTDSGCSKNHQIRQKCQLDTSHNFFEKERLKILNLNSSEIESLKPLHDALQK